MSVRWQLFDIALIGTSLTLKGGWEENLRSRLQALTPRPVRTYNFGDSAFTAANGVGAVPPRARLRPRVAIFEYAMNDAYMGAVTVSAFTANMNTLLDQYLIEQPGSQIFLMTMNPAIGAAAPNLSQLPSYYQALRNVSTARGVGLIDNFPLWGTPSAADIPDGVHPTAARNIEIMVPNIIAALSPLV